MQNPILARCLIKSLVLCKIDAKHCSEFKLHPARVSDPPLIRSAGCRAFVKHCNWVPVAFACSWKIKALISRQIEIVYISPVPLLQWKHRPSSCRADRFSSMNRYQPISARPPVLHACCAPRSSLDSYRHMFHYYLQDSALNKESIQRFCYHFRATVQY